MITPTAIKLCCQNDDIMFKTGLIGRPMMSIDTRVAMGGIATCIGVESQSDHYPGKHPVKDTNPSLMPSPVQSSLVQKAVSFSTYGSKNEHLAGVVSSRKTGQIICEIPSKEVQGLHVYLELTV